MIVYVITSFTLLLLIFSIDLSPQISFGWPKARNRKWNHKNYSKSVYVHYHKWSLYRWIRKKSRYIYRRTNEQKEIMQWPNCRPGSDERQFWYHFVWAYHIYIYIVLIIYSGIWATYNEFSVGYRTRMKEKVTAPWIYSWSGCQHRRRASILQ